MAPDALRALCETVKNEAETIVCVLAAVQTEKGSVNFAASCAKGAVQAGAHAGNLVRAVAKAAVAPAAENRMRPWQAARMPLK